MQNRHIDFTVGDRRAKYGEKVFLYGASSKSLCVNGPLEGHEYVDEVPGKEGGCRGEGVWRGGRGSVAGSHSQLQTAAFHIRQGQSARAGRREEEDGGEGS